VARVGIDSWRVFFVDYGNLATTSASNLCKMRHDVEERRIHTRAFVMDEVRPVFPDRFRGNAVIEQARIKRRCKFFAYTDADIVFLYPH
jgi:hypothetical protein